MTATEPDSTHTDAPAPVPAPDAAGRLLAALLTASAIPETSAGPALAD